jgi:hypothetical protein
MGRKAPFWEDTSPGWCERGIGLQTGFFIKPIKIIWIKNIFAFGTASAIR